MNHRFLFLLAFCCINSHAEEALIDRPDYDQNVPLYDQATPHFAFGARAAVRKLPIKTALGNSFQVLGEYLLPWQAAGVFSIGAHVGNMALMPPDGSIPLCNSNVVGGFQARYQLKVFRAQILVPFVAVEWETMRLKKQYGSDAQLSISTSGMSYGLMFLLSTFDSMTARDSYQSLGLVRSYLTGEVQPVSLSTPSLSLKGTFWFWGLRLEFE